MPSIPDPPSVIIDGVCSQWTTLERVRARPHCADLTIISDTTIIDAISDASNMLYRLTQHKFSGICNGYVRPIARPRAMEELIFTRLIGFGYNSTWGMCMSGHEMGYTRQCYAPPEIDLGVYPLTSIREVKINGVIIPPTEYRIDNNKLLTRVLSSATMSPTEMWGWPVCQRYDLPDTEPATFSVAYNFGMMPPSEGVSAATGFAAQLAISRSGGKSSLPERLQTLNRQGVSMAILDPMTFLDKGLTGIYEVDLFIRAHNPATGTGSARRRPGVWSPDLGSRRRPTG